VSDSEEYRRRAEECMIQAAGAKDPAVKRQYEEMARGWLALARAAERRDPLNHENARE
jgi:hypothetical protein